ncbi:MAG: dipeptide/oligopeptide/nickel ABC transporter ATP-binding protein [Elusimicrobiota bacterium]|nr:dipeptide/oligopeptide/nickel ABC transporter ATP-binding protein [Endomicrobiia bacterium]MDW8165211.1 dipeptide/oligopeptide/nickel ABC transporter ATP-binding protein [Elusimicrobiota bacterium]
MKMKDNILVVKDLTKSYPIYSELLHIEISRKKVFSNLNFSLEYNKTLGILGPSGVGKTTLVKIISKIEEPDYGEVLIENKNIKDYSFKEIALKLQLLFQNPYSMLNPKFKVGYLIRERIKGYFKLNNLEVDKRDIDLKIKELLEVTKLPIDILDMFPYQLSGGQRQRVAMLLVLSLYPKILILDEPLSALDVSLQAQMLNFLGEIKEKFKLSYIFITHDKNLAEYFCDNLLILYEDGKYEIL